MATVTGFTAERMEAIEAASVVDGEVSGDDLILTRYDGSTINAGSVRGPTGSPGVTSIEMAAIFPVGMIIDYIDTTPPTNWLTMIGQTIVNGQTLYPALWAKIPIGMKSGSSIVMPDTRGKVSVGHNSGDVDFDTIGEVGGEKTHTLTSAEMPSHTHVQNAHTHVQDAHTHVQNAHTHIQNAHQHNGVTGDETATHVHAADLGAATRAFLTTSAADSMLQIYAIGSGGDYSNMPLNILKSSATDVENDVHQHYFITDPATAINQNATAVNQNATAVNQNATAVNQNTGGGTAHNNVQPYVVFLKIIKVA